MVERIKYRNQNHHDFFNSDKSTIKHYQFTVVNNPQPTQYFEDCQMRDMSTNDEVPVIRIMDDPSQNMAPALGTEVDIIFTPDYLYSYIRSTSGSDFKTNCKVVVRPTNPIYARSISDNENYTFSRLQKDGLKVLYMNQYAGFISEVGIDTILYDADHVTPKSTFKKLERNSCLWRNIPWHVEATTYMTPDEGYEMLAIAPYITNQRHNLKLTPLHKFDEYILRAGDTIKTTIFEESTYSLLHVAAGSAIINEMVVNRYEFYEHDPKVSASITAVEDCFIVQVSKVPSIDFTGLIE